MANMLNENEVKEKIITLLSGMQCATLCLPAKA
jgi:hypothetical protein